MANFFMGMGGNNFDAEIAQGFRMGMAMNEFQMQQAREQRQAEMHQYLIEEAKQKIGANERAAESATRLTREMQDIPITIQRQVQGEMLPTDTDLSQVPITTEDYTFNAPSQLQQDVLRAYGSNLSPLLVRMAQAGNFDLFKHFQPVPTIEKMEGGGLAQRTGENWQYVVDRTKAPTVKEIEQNGTKYYLEWVPGQGWKTVSSSPLSSGRQSPEEYGAHVAAGLQARIALAQKLFPNMDKKMLWELITRPSDPMNLQGIPEGPAFAPNPGAPSPAAPSLSAPTPPNQPTAPSQGQFGVKGGKVLTERDAQALLKEAGGDPVKARQLAKDRKYRWGN